MMRNLGKVALMAVVFTLGSGPRGVTGQSIPAPLDLRVEMDHPVYLPGEPVLIGLTVKNESASVFEDLATLVPEQGFLRFKVVRDSQPVPWAGLQATWVFSHEGSRLPPRQQFCDIVSLSDLYGRDLESVSDGRTFHLKRALQPGSYSVRTKFRTRLGVRKELSDFVIEGNEVHFTVLDSKDLPVSDRRALEVLDPSSIPGSRSAARWNAVHTAELKSSRYLAALAVRYLPTDSVDAVQIAEQYVSQGGGRLAAAAVLRVNFERLAGRLDRCDAWLARSQSRPESALFACFLSSWREMVALRRFYGEAGD